MALPSLRVSRDVQSQERPQVQGKFLYLDNEKFWVRGVTYGTFRPDDNGNEYDTPGTVEQDFAQIAASGLNAIRTYSVPPRWLLDTAVRHGLRVMVGLPWEQHVTFLDDRTRARSIEERVRAGVRACAGHPAVLCYAIGNEIPASIVRWHGPRRVERYIERLYRAAKAEDPASLVTYVNYPTTEYLDLTFLDLICFNVYLESQDRLEAYLARLHNLAGDRPLVMAEIGLDSRRHGEDTQARVLDWQVRTAFASGCAGAFVFAWTDEWHRGGHDVGDWDFGLTTRDRRPKPALAAVSQAFAEVPFPKDLPWPRISVVVCSLNGARTIRRCLDGLLRLEYPNFEVIVVNDGSTDETGAIASEYGVRVISTQHGGLSSARNVGLKAATGEIVAYIDDDAWPDPHWLAHLAATFLSTSHVGVGGPNIAPSGGGPIAQSVANAPGGPIHVLLSDREAEHIPGCNMAFRKAAVEAVGAFDPRFRTAGDDVDICWRLRERGWTLGFSPGAMVWHYRRDSVSAYWRQQRGYGRAEALLEQKWPEKYNAAGHVAWAGRVYGNGFAKTPRWGSGRIYQGRWGTAPFQSLYQPAPGTLSSLPFMPEWYLVILFFGALSALGALWAPLLWALPPLGLAVGVALRQALVSAARASFPHTTSRPKLQVLTTLLYLLQPLARLAGRMGLGLTPWRRRGPRALAWPRPRRFAIWSEHWQAPMERVQALLAALRAAGAVVLGGGDFDRWDLEVRGGPLGSIRLFTAVEEHGMGRQLMRIRSRPHVSAVGLLLMPILAGLACVAALDHAWVACGILVAAAAAINLRALRECASVSAVVRQVLVAMGGLAR